MPAEKINSHDKVSVELIRGAGHKESVSMTGTFSAVCRDAEGNIKWSEEFPNAVTTVGKNDLLDKYFSGAAYTARFYVGLITSNGYSAISANDTSASHAGWLEAFSTTNPNYSQGARPILTFATASAASKAGANAATFTISTAGTVKGAFLSTANTKGSTTGILYSAGLFTVGDKVVTGGDTLNVTYTASA